MSVIILTDAKYRSAISAARTFGRAGHQVIAVQSRSDTDVTPPVFSSRYVTESRWIEGSASDDGYAERLLELVRSYDNPVVFPVGAATTNAISREHILFSRNSNVLISPPKVMDALNDKEVVHRRAIELGIPVPEEFSGEPDRYPVIIKPHCGEQFGLTAGERYRIARNRAEFEAGYEAISRYDPSPIVQELVKGEGNSACILLDHSRQLVGAFCHRRIREYPISGGPSSCCESSYDEAKIDAARRLLQTFGFVGLAMVEFKGDRLLEVNPRVWGSFPLTTLAGSPIALRYAEAAADRSPDYTPCDYQTGVRMRFLLNDTLSTLSLFAHFRLIQAAGGVADVFRAKEAFFDTDDLAPVFSYLKSAAQRKFAKK